MTCWICGRRDWAWLKWTTITGQRHGTIICTNCGIPHSESRRMHAPYRSDPHFHSSPSPCQHTRQTSWSCERHIGWCGTCLDCGQPLHASLRYYHISRGTLVWHPTSIPCVLTSTPRANGR